MPTPAESLTVQSDKKARQDAVSACVAQLIGEGTPNDQAIAICINQADKSMGTKQAQS